MARQPKNKATDNAVDNVEDNEAVENTGKTPKTGEKDLKGSDATGDADYIDSEKGDIAENLQSILNVPTETISADTTSETKEDVLQGFGKGADQHDPINPDSGGDFGGGEDFSDLGEDSGLFEDNELLAQIGVELIDMMMTYGAMAIAKDWDNEERYSIKEKRKKKLEAPLQKILENREIKTAPELVFAFILIATYSPVWIDAVQERRAKKKGNEGNPIPGRQAVKTKPKPKSSPSPFEGMQISDGTPGEANLTIEPQVPEGIQEPEDDPMAEMMSQMKPKRKSGRPVGSTDLKPRNSLDENTRKKQIEKAKALRKDGWSFKRIASELNVSEATATRWVRS